MMKRIKAKFGFLEFTLRICDKNETSQHLL
jgi:hypothetical protein